MNMFFPGTLKQGSDLNDVEKTLYQKAYRHICGEIFLLVLDNQECSECNVLRLNHLRNKQPEFHNCGFNSSHLTFILQPDCFIPKFRNYPKVKNYLKILNPLIVC